MSIEHSINRRHLLKYIIPAAVSGVGSVVASTSLAVATDSENGLRIDSLSSDLATLKTAHEASTMQLNKDTQSLDDIQHYLSIVVKWGSMVDGRLHSLEDFQKAQEARNKSTQK